ncbi:outer membrane protein OmpW [Endozoicomonas sp. OPT23]|uniref:OmpW/AlkL family protein n=1 Tax=Endozoicomonas sp. OPT23 TaxID=2072845 RepID=UPI00129C08D7|nr:OmpW family outer membrane protein [Endozoicomonas sp. OPT23]MRI31688.1 outer membrane protein OmpW [Endozoicomonas sp. OPT23]
MFKRPLAVAILAATTAIAATSAQAYEAGDFLVRGGLAAVNPDVDSGLLEANGNKLANTAVDVDSNTQLGVSFTYMYTDNIGIELLAATPFKHTLTGKKGLSGLGDFADVKHLPPTVSLQYYPMDSNSAFQPYAGVGVNYTVFFSEDFKSGASATYKDLELESSLGLTAQVGFDYKLNENWSLNAAAWYMDINTTAEFKGRADNAKYKIDVELDPMVYMAGVSYKF